MGEPDAPVHGSSQYQRGISGRYFRTSAPDGARSGGGVPRTRGTVTAVALDPVERLVGGGDQLGRRPAVRWEGRHADRGTDRDRSALLADIGVVAECLQDALRGPGGL